MTCLDESLGAQLNGEARGRPRVRRRQAPARTSASVAVLAGVGEGRGWHAHDVAAVTSSMMSRMARQGSSLLGALRGLCSGHTSSP